MTAFAAWVGVDQRGPASLYLASDSRISWADADFRSWDFGRKVFACTRYPDVVGYVGDVLFPSLVLGQVTALIDAGVLYRPEAGPEERFGQVAAVVRQSFVALPPRERRPFWIVYGTRIGRGLSCTFALAVLAWDKSGWSERWLSIPSTSSHIVLLGSGAAEISRWDNRWYSSSQGATSRAVFSAFCDAVAAGADRQSGGAPQVVGLYRIDPARAFGVYWKGTPYLFGAPVPSDASDQLEAIEWRNSLFERVTRSGALLLGAQRHHAPKGLGSSSK